MPVCGCSYTSAWHTYLESRESPVFLASLGCRRSSLLLEASDSRLDLKPFTVGEESPTPPTLVLLLLLLLLLLGGRGVGCGLRGVAGVGVVAAGVEWWSVVPPVLGVPGTLPSASPSSRLWFGESLTEELDPRPESRHATLQGRDPVNGRHLICRREKERERVMEMDENLTEYEDTPPPPLPHSLEHSLPPQSSYNLPASKKWHFYF